MARDMAHDVTVVCVLKSGGHYTPEWVRKLARGISEHLPTARFRCLTDMDLAPVGLADAAIPLLHGWPGWWSLVEWWRPGLFAGRVLAMGLDTLIVGSLEELASCQLSIAGISDFYQPKVLASGVMTWDGDAGAVVYDTFIANPRGLMNANRRMDPYMRQLLPHAARLQDHYPGQIVSYKAHARKGIPENARIVCGHGKPRFDERTAGWAYTWWMGL